jgi:aspartate/glutamate racemase
MKTIGLLGGMSWESTLTYYRRINELVRQRLGGLHSARIVLHSVDFADIEELQRCGQWDAAGSLLAAAARTLEAAGADFCCCARTPCTRSRRPSRRRCRFPCCTSPTPPLPQSVRRV